jgi:hypothetical protein
VLIAGIGDMQASERRQDLEHMLSEVFCLHLLVRGLHIAAAAA